MGELPQGCFAFPGNVSDMEVTCSQQPALAPGAHRNLAFPITIPPSASRNKLTARATVTSSDSELRTDNNSATKWLLIPPATGKGIR